jgi:protein-S-isoprenylcysteine O-methyltransferase Ste14
MLLSAIGGLGFAVSPLFPSGIDELLFVLVYFIWFYFEIINQVFIALKNKDSIIKIKNDKLSLLVVYLGIIVVMYTESVLGGLKVSSHFAQLPVWTFYLGIGIMLFGEALRQWSIYSLGKFFTYPVVIMTDHRLIKKGPYKYVRHPAYLGGMLTFVGIGIALQSWAGAVAAGIIMLVAYSYRIHVEEMALKMNFKKEYEQYRKSTPALFPV